ncbi:hypothetical protein KAR91_68925, partial [Candidatus Pacearchaeota archaeon]|nr:hypothetical protein [Candidatus Pacearchaeota archaeon]
EKADKQGLIFGVKPLISARPMGQRIFEVGMRMSKSNERFIAEKFPEQADFTLADKFAQGVGQGAVSLAAAVGMGLIAGPQAPAIAFGLSAAAGGFVEAREKDKDLDTSLKIGGLLGFAEGGLEFWGINRLIKLKGGSIKKLIENAVNGMATEFTQEFTQSTASGTIKTATGIRDFEGLDSVKEIIGDALFEGAVGAVLGGGAGISMSLAQRKAVEDGLVSMGMDKETAQDQSDKLMKDSMEDALTSVESLPESKVGLGGKTFKEEQQRSEIVVKAQSGEELTSSEKEALEEIYSNLTAEGVIEKSEEIVTPEVMAKEISEATKVEEIEEPVRVVPVSEKLGSYIDKKLQEEITKEGRRLDELEIAEFGADQAKQAKDAINEIISESKNEEEAIEKINKAGLELEFIEISDKKELKDLRKDINVFLKEQNKLIKDLKPELIAKRETTILKEKIQNIKRGFKTGVVATKTVLRERIKAINNVLSPLKVHDKGKFVRTIGQVTEGDIDSDVKFQKLIEKIEQRVDKLVEIAAEKKKRAKLERVVLKQPKRPENVTDVKYQNKIDEIVKKLGKTKAEKQRSIRNMSTNDLEEMSGEISIFKEKGREIFKDKKKQSAMASEILRAGLIKNAGGLKDGQFAKGTIEHKKAKEANFAERKRIPFRSPLNSIKKIFGSLGEKIFYDSIDAADTLKTVNATRRQLDLKDSMNRNNVTAFGLGETIEVDGKTFQINDILSMYIKTKDEQSLKALIAGNNISKDTIDSFISEAKKDKPNYFKFADETQVIVAEKYPAISETMEKFFNKTLKKVKVYFPLKRIALDKSSEELYEGSESELIYEEGIRVGKGFSYTSADKGLTITRQDIDDRFQTELSLDFIGDAIRAINTQEHFIAYSPLQKAFNKTINDPMIQEAVVFNHSEDAWKDFNEYLKVVINPQLLYQGGGKYQSFIKKTRHGLSKAFLGYNVVTAGKQLPSLTLALKHTSPQELVISMKRIALSKEARNKVYALEPSLKNRVVSRDIREIMEEVGKLPESDIKRRLQGLSAKIDKGAFAMIMNMDKYAVLSVYDSVYRHQRKTKSVEESKDIANKAVITTQPQGGIKDLPGAYRTNKEWLRMVLMFTNQLNKIWNMVSEELPAEIANKEFKKASTGIASVIISSVGIYIMSHGRLPQDPDDFFDAIFGNFISSIPIIGNWGMSFARGYDPSISPAESIVSNLKYMGENLKDGDFVGASVEALFVTSVYAELPFSQPKRTLTGAFDLFSGETDDLRRLIWSESALETEENKSKNRSF